MLDRSYSIKVREKVSRLKMAVDRYRWWKGEWKSFLAFSIVNSIAGTFLGMEEGEFLLYIIIRTRRFPIISLINKH
jgi:hypothetical protein